MMMGLLAAAIFLGAIWICICFNAWDRGLTIREWLKICDASSREEGRYLKQKFL